MPVSYLNRAASNRLLASLPAAALDRMLPHLSLVSIATGETLYQAGTAQPYVYFPVSGAVVLSYVGGATHADISVVGNEGVIGIPLFLNGAVSPCRAVVRDAGSAYRISTHRLTAEFNRAGQPLRVFLAYARALTAQMAQTAVCNGAATIERDLCAACGHANTCPLAGRLLT
ncbi:Crp/Fnr family transcriptional regulator [Massilia sp. TWR1-2-2]|uniref:Crp/Fnr family transcriptional regulator n=1 Tax=Massilia sp. TWR1-2-2 TaxID=2804584 RepID=UPI003CF25AC9